MGVFGCLRVLFCFSKTLIMAYITANSNYTLSDVQRVVFRYSSTRIYVLPSVTKDGVVLVDLQVWESDDSAFYGSESMSFSEATLEALSSGESGEVSQFLDVVAQAVVDALEAISLNSGVTFTVVN